MKYNKELVKEKVVSVHPGFTGMLISMLIRSMLLINSYIGGIMI